MEQVKNYEFIDKNIEKVCTNKHREDDDEYINMLEKWVDNSINAINSRNRPFSLLLVGENRESMLNWAKSLGSYIYWQGKKDLRKWDPDANFIILDEFKWNDKEVDNFRQYIKCELEIHDSDKYKRKISIYDGPKACIILTNHYYDPIERIKNDLLREHIKSNVVRVDIGDKELVMY